MKKDYAKYRYQKKKPANDTVRRTDLFVVFFLALVISVTILWACISKIRAVMMQNQANAGFVASLKQFFYHPPANVATASVPKPQVASEKPRDEVQFNFYDTLPAMQMKASAPASVAPPVVISTPKVSATKTVSVETLGYTLQFASFKSAADASQMRLSLLLSGVEAEIVKIGETYRVQQGRYVTVSQAKQEQQRLQSKGVECVIEKTLNQ